MMGAMRVFWSVGVGVVHSVENRIGSRRQIGTALPDPSEKIKEPFPESVHHKHLMGGISVEKKTLAKQGEIPVKQEEDNYDHSADFFSIVANIRVD